MERAVGQWHGTTTAGDEKGFGVMTGRWSNDKTAVLSQERVFGPELTETWYGRSIKRQGDKTGTMKMCYAAKDGTQFEDEITFTKEGKVLTGKGKRKGFDGDGEAFSADVTVTSSDEDQIIWRITNGIINGVKRPDLILKFTRVNRDDLVE